ncbi:MAG TPA: hypothetical protein VGB53_07750 [Rubricoccaceae bacterium]|jgi:hypothetical protein
MTRLAPLALLVLAAGCGPLRPVLTPSLASVSGLAPDLVPEQGASVAVVTARGPGRGIDGRVFDRDTGAALADVMLDVTDATGIRTAVQTDVLGAFRVATASGISGVESGVPIGARLDLCHGWLDARPEVGPDSSATVLVLLAPAAC